MGSLLNILDVTSWWSCPAGSDAEGKRLSKDAGVLSLANPDRPIRLQ